jgi:hypothetical protein
MIWKMELKRGGVTEMATSGSLESRDFLHLLESVRQTKQAGLSTTRVESKVSHWGDHISVSFSVSLECPQTLENIEYAAKLAFVTATRFINEAVSQFDQSMPMLPTG